MRRTDEDIILEAVGKIEKIKPGTVITHLVMEEILGVGRLENQQKYYRLVNRLKRDLERNHGIFLHTESKVGYVLLVPGAEIGECIRDIKRGARLSMRGAARAQMIRADRIEDPALRSRTLCFAQRTANMALLIRQGFRDFEQLPRCEDPAALGDAYAASGLL